MSTEQRTFGLVDNIVFFSMLAISAGIGIYHALAGGKQKTAEEFLVGGRNLHPFPVAMSLMASFMSAVSMLGTPSEMYIYDTMYFIYCAGFFINGILTQRLFLPIFFKLKLTSCYCYLARRFSNAVRLCATFTFLIQMTIYMGIVMYAPSLALQAVTGLSMWVSVLATGLVCTFYTAVGGMKAVVWTDAFQSIIMIGGVVVVCIVGAVDLGGYKEIWRINVDDDRIRLFDTTFDLTLRHNVWNVVLGSTFIQLSMFSVNQAMVQRYLSCGTYKKAVQALWISVFAKFLLHVVLCLAGVVMYAYYNGCDPYTLGKVDTTDQLFPLLVMDMFYHIPGLPGIFVAAVMSAALSTVSSGLNSIAAVIGEDIILQFKPDLKDADYAKISKILVAGFGLLSIALAFLAQYMGDVLQWTLDLLGMMGGPLVGLFSLGAFVPWCNSIGAISGLFGSLAITLTIKIGSKIYPAYVAKPLLSIAECAFNVTSTTVSPTIYNSLMSTAAPLQEYEGFKKVFSLSYMLYAPLGFASCFIIGILISGLTGFNNPSDVDPDTMHPFVDAMCCCLSRKTRSKIRLYNTRDDDLENKDGIKLQMYSEQVEGDTKK